MGITVGLFPIIPCGLLLEPSREELLLIFSSLYQLPPLTFDLFITGYPA
jgi:hypothetical protein